MQTAMNQTTTQSVVRVNGFVRSVYNWMTIGLALTGGTAYLVLNSKLLLGLFFKMTDQGMQSTGLSWVLLIGTFGMVFFLSARINKMSATTATTLFVVYSILMGAMLSTILIFYTTASIASVFLICSLTFLATSVYGWVTKRDLTGMGQFMMMGLIGIIIASIVNWFVGSTAIDAVISYIGVIVFVGLTAYDTQKLKAMALAQPEGLSGGVVRKGAIMGALTLYLDFINLFLFLLRILGDRR